MQISGVQIEDVSGRGIEGYLPVEGLTLLFGRNASGKTVFLESTASFFESTQKWRGRRGRIDDDDQYAYGAWYLRGDWDGSDWKWLRDVMRNQYEWSEEERDQGMVEAEPSAPVVTDARSTSRAEFLLALSQSCVDQDPAGTIDGTSVFAALAHLTHGMLVTYAPWPGAVVDAVVDCSALTDAVRAHVSKAAEELSGTDLGERLRHIAVTVDGVAPLMGLGVLDEINFDVLELTPPSTIHVTATDQPTEAVIEAAIFASWVIGYEDETKVLRSTDDGRYVLHPEIRNSAREITDIIRRGPVPAFLLEQGLPEVQIPTPELWYRTGRVVIGLRTPSGKFIDIRQTSAAVARWLHILALLAVDDWLRQFTSAPDVVAWVGGLPTRIHARNPVHGRVVILDEPELHLHPVAQDQVADWLTELTARNVTTAIVATHSPQIINAYGPHVRLLGVRRDAGVTQLHDLTADTLGALELAASRYGSDKAGWIQVTRGLLLVEGEHDRDVIQHVYGEHLKRERLAVIPIRGHKNLEGTVVSDFFGRMGIPVRVLLDDVRAAATTGDTSVELKSSEEKVVRQIVFQRAAYPQLDVVAYDEPDIWCAVPMAAVQRVWPQARTVSWAEIIESWESTDVKNRPGFKSYAMKRLEVTNTKADDFIAAVIAATLPDDTHSRPFTEAMETVFDSFR